MKKTLLSVLIGSAVLMPAIAQAELSGNVAATSNYLWRGMEQTGGDAAISGGIDYADESGFYAGTWASNASWATDMTTELDLYFGFGGDNYDVGFVYFMYPDAADGTDVDFAEIYASYSIEALTLGVAVLATSDADTDGDFGDSIYFSADYAVEVGNGAELGLHVGTYTGDFIGEDTVDLGVSLSKDGFTFGVSSFSQDGASDAAESLKFYVSYGVDIEL